MQHGRYLGTIYGHLQKEITNACPDCGVENNVTLYPEGGHAMFDPPIECIDCGEMFLLSRGDATGAGAQAAYKRLEEAGLEAEREDLAVEKDQRERHGHE